LRENCVNQGVDGVRVVQYDAETSLPFADESFDVVVVDAPCSGTGTIRHNPEIRYTIAPADFDELSSKQRRILANASKSVKKGGRLIYSTCSLEIEENEAVADDFLSRNADYEKIRPSIPERFLSDDSYARIMPHLDRADGFFIAAFKKRD
ncbi:MAG: methyltransferase domain-containing protein, partial [Acidobacteria bacterium]|nr:methyltransferase domain-containing protein [Acidobacteriota bacterium]